MIDLAIEIFSDNNVVYFPRVLLVDFFFFFMNSISGIVYSSQTSFIVFCIHLLCLSLVFLPLFSLIVLYSSFLILTLLSNYYAVKS